MALECWIEHQQAQGNTPGVKMARTLLGLYGDVVFDGQDPIAVARQGSLSQVTAEFKAGRLNTPDAVTRGWQTRWAVWGEKVGLNIIVPDFPGTEESLNEALIRGDKPIYVPAELSTQDKRHLLGKIWPQMQSHAVDEGNAVTNEANHTGWRYTESATDAPNTDTTEGQLRGKLKKMGREGLTVAEYVIASQDARVLGGQYFDEGLIWSRLLGSRHEGYVVHALFLSHGGLRVDWALGRELHDPGVGGRSSLGVTEA